MIILYLFFIGAEVDEFNSLTYLKIISTNLIIKD